MPRARFAPATRRVATLVDPETDQRFQVSAERPPAASYGRRWCIVFDDARQQVIADLNSAAAFKVFLALPDYLSWTEFRPLNQAAVAKRLKITQGSVSRVMKDLLNRSIVEREGSGPVTRWKLSLNWGWRGNAAAYHAAAREAAEAKLATGASSQMPQKVYYVK